MKKIISFIAVLAMVFSLIPNAFAAMSTSSLTLTADVVEFTEGEDGTFYEWYEETTIPEGYDAYMVTFSVSGIEDTLGYTKTGGTNAKPKYTGYSMDSGEIRILSSVSNSKFNADYSYVLDKAFSATPDEGFLSDADGYMTYFEGTFVCPSAPGTEITESIPGLLTLALLVEEGTSVEFTLAEESYLKFFGYTNSDVTDENAVTALSGALTMAPFTLGATAPAGPTVDKVEETTSAGITAYTVSTLAEKVIMTKTFQNVAVKPGMGLIVTNNGVTRQFGGDLYAVLGSPAEGTVTIGSLTFGLVVEDTASASQFTFELR